MGDVGEHRPSVAWIGGQQRVRRLATVMCLGAMVGVSINFSVNALTPERSRPSSDQALSAEALEQRVQHLSEALRCLVCQNQTIADSQAQLAIDLKQQVREQLGRGDSEAAVIEFMVQRYGEFVLYRPRWSAVTAALWCGPLVMLGAGLVALALRLRRQRWGHDDDSMIEEEP